jgi:hypothetical protein
MDNNFNDQAPNQAPGQAPEQAPLQPANPPLSSPAANHQVRTAVLWFLSPFMVFVGALVMSIAFRLAGVDSRLTNIGILLLGLVGMVMLVVGPVMGIIKLTRR